MSKFRKKPVVVEAYEFQNRVGPDGRPPWIIAAVTAGKVSFHNRTNAPPFLKIQTLEGEMTAHCGDMIIQGVNGEIYPCKPDIFAKTYEPADTPEAIINVVTDSMIHGRGAVRITHEPHERMRLTDLPDVDTSDIPEVGEEWFKKATHRVSPLPAGYIPGQGIPIDHREPIAEDDPRHPEQRYFRFSTQLQHAINGCSMENGSDTPDFILAEFLTGVLREFDKAHRARDKWNGGSARELNGKIEYLEATLDSETKQFATAMQLVSEACDRAGRMGGECITDFIEKQGRLAATFATHAEQIARLEQQLEAEGQHTAAANANIDRLNTEIERVTRRQQGDLMGKG